MAIHNPTANAVKHKGATIMQAGNHDGTNITNDLSLQENAAAPVLYGSKVALATSPTDSGNVGGLRAVSTGTYSQMEKQKYVAKVLGTRIAGEDNDILQSGAADFGRRKAIHAFQGYERLHITSWDYVTGVATKGGQAGVDVLPSGVDGATGSAADTATTPTMAIPGELVYMTTGQLATTKQYGS